MRKIEEEGKKRTRHTILLPEPPQHVILSLSLSLPSIVYRLLADRSDGRTDMGLLDQGRGKIQVTKIKGLDGRTDGL